MYCMPARRIKRNSETIRDWCRMRPKIFTIHQSTALWPLRLRRWNKIWQPPSAAKVMENVPAPWRSYPWCNGQAVWSLSRRIGLPLSTLLKPVFWQVRTLSRMPVSVLTLGSLMNFLLIRNCSFIWKIRPPSISNPAGSFSIAQTLLHSTTSGAPRSLRTISWTMLQAMRLKSSSRASTVSRTSTLSSNKCGTWVKTTSLAARIPTRSYVSWFMGTTRHDSRTFSWIRRIKWRPMTSSLEMTSISIHLSRQCFRSNPKELTIRPFQCIRDRKIWRKWRESDLWTWRTTLMFNRLCLMEEASPNYQLLQHLGSNNSKIARMVSNLIWRTRTPKMRILPSVVTIWPIFPSLILRLTRTSAKTNCLATRKRQKSLR